MKNFSKTKTLTQLTMGMIKNFIEENFDDVSFSEGAKKYFKSNFLGEKSLYEDHLKLKDGKPEEVSEWLRSEYGLDLDLSGDYAIATVLKLLIEFENKAYFQEIDNVGFGSHDGCELFSYKGNDLIKLNVKNEKFEMFVSETEIPLKSFNSRMMFLKDIDYGSDPYNGRGYDDVILTLPIAKVKEEVDLGAKFQGSSFKNKQTNKEFQIDSAKTIALFNLGLDSVEIEQFGTVTAVVSGCSEPRKYYRKTIKNDFYVYIRFNDKLLFACKVEKSDFIKDKELENFKMLETV